jgi:ankyrin repeat protein
MANLLLERILDGRTDLVLDYMAQGHPATSKDEEGVRLIERCAYYGDVSALRVLLERGESFASLGRNLGLDGAAFHGHWRLCEFLLESGAAANEAAPDTGETPLHSALCTPTRTAHDLVLRVLLAHGAAPSSGSVRH